MDQRIIDIFSHPGQVPVPDPRRPSDLTMTEMARIGSLPQKQRDAALEPYLHKWIEENADALTVAYYMSAANFTLEEAIALERVVRARLTAQLRQQALREMAGGFALVFMALVLFVVLALLEQRPNALWNLVLIVLLAGGLVALGRGLALLRRVSPPPDDEIERT